MTKKKTSGRKPAAESPVTVETSPLVTLAQQIDQAVSDRDAFRAAQDDAASQAAAATLTDLLTQIETHLAHLRSDGGTLHVA